jgi:hypothetical protein
MKPCRKAVEEMRRPTRDRLSGAGRWTRQIVPSQDQANKTSLQHMDFSNFRGNLSVAVTNNSDGTLSIWRVVMIKRKHIDHAELLELGKLLLLLVKRQQIELNLSSERNKRRTEVEKLARAS